MTTEALQGHTPGPWTHKATAGDHDFAVYPEATGRDVALVRDFNEANARLIAAAPEMLEALQQLYEHCSMVHKHWGDGSNQREADAAIKAGLAAIARATNA